LNMASAWPFGGSRQQLACSRQILRHDFAAV
jgi:hypothetical protein